MSEVERRLDDFAEAVADWVTGESEAAVPPDRQRAAILIAVGKEVAEGAGKELEDVGRRLHSIRLEYGIGNTGASIVQDCIDVAAAAVERLKKEANGK